MIIPYDLEQRVKKMLHTDDVTGGGQYGYLCPRISP